MNEKVLMNIITSMLSDSGNDAYGLELKMLYDSLTGEATQYAMQVDNCKAYLLSVDPKLITAEACLAALGCDKNGDYIPL